MNSQAMTAAHGTSDLIWKHTGEQDAIVLGKRCLERAAAQLSNIYNFHTWRELHPNDRNTPPTGPCE